MEDIGILSGIMAATGGINLSPDDIEHYVDAIKSAGSVLSKQQIEEMDDDEYLRKMREKMQKKQG